MNYTSEQWDALMRRLNDGGCPVLHNHRYKIAPTGLSIEKMPGISLSQIFTLAHGGTGYAIELILRNEANRPIDIQGFQIKTPWGIPKVALLPTPKKSSARYPHYCFPEPGPYYEREFVLNRLFARRKSRMNPGEELEGVLVASSEEMIPVDVAHLARIVATLVMFDSRGDAFSAQFRVPIIRREVTGCEHAVGSRANTNAKNADWQEIHECAR
jgi:hypothetical protein